VKAEQQHLYSKPQEEEVQFHPFRLLGVIMLVTGLLAVICYALQIYYLG